MPASDRKRIVRDLFAAYHQGKREIVEAILDDDLTFTSPYDDAIDKAAYFERCWPTSNSIGSHDLERIVEADDDVLVTYLCRMKDGKSFRNTEVLMFSGSRIRAIEVYFGASYRNGKFVRSKSA